MTLITMPRFDTNMFKEMDKYFIGFDEQFNRLTKMHDDITKNIPNYPPYNVKKTGDNTYVIEIAAAGFAKQDIEIELADNKMIVKHESDYYNLVGDNYIYFNWWFEKIED